MRGGPPAPPLWSLRRARGAARFSARTIDPHDLAVDGFDGGGTREVGLRLPLHPVLDRRRGLRLRPDRRRGLRLDLRRALRLDLRYGLRLDLRHGLRLDLRHGLRLDLRHGLRLDLRHALVLVLARRHALVLVLARGRALRLGLGLEVLFARGRGLSPDFVLMLGFGRERFMGSCLDAADGLHPTLRLWLDVGHGFTLELDVRLGVDLGDGLGLGLRHAPRLGFDLELGWGLGRDQGVLRGRDGAA